MIRNILYIILFASLLGCRGPKEVVIAPTPSVFEFTETINSEGLRADLTVLSHDSLEGRDTGSKGQEMAARYLADKYKKLGLTAVGDNGTYFQHVELNQPITIGNTYKVYDKEGGLIDESAHSADEIGNFRTSTAGATIVKGEIVFAGYGIKNDSLDQFPAEVEGKWVLAFYEQSNYGNLLAELTKRKAVGAILMLYNDEAAFISRAEETQQNFKTPGRMSLAYLDTNSDNSETITIINPVFAAQLLELDGVEELNTLQEKIKTDPSGFEPKALNAVLEHIHTKKENTVVSKNIVALIEGSDPKLKNEIVVVSSHYDHVGIGRPDSTGDVIYNGADDDGSGTVGVLHVGQALVAAKRAGAGLKRSVLILHVTGEEKGLLGSRYYSDHPIFPIQETIANLNVDMIGRRDFEHPNDGDYIYIIGGKIISSGIDEVLKEANEESVNITLNDRYNDLNDPNQFYRRSDHWNFGRLGVPFAFFFNGVHADYHRPSDEVDKIDFEALTKRSQLIFTATAKLANAANRPMVDNQEFIEKTKQLPR